MAANSDDPAPPPEDDTLSKEWVTKAIDASKNVIVSEMKQLFESSFNDLKRSNLEHNDSQIRELKRLKYHEPHVFKKKGNEDQYRFNAKLKENFEEAVDHLHAGNLPKTFDSLEQGIASIDVRQKHVLLADSSDLGWLVVNQYKQHDLAQDSDDEKKIFRAESRAKAKVNELKRKSWNKASPNIQQTSSATVQNNPQKSVTSGPNASLPRGPCYGCGKFGHFRSHCPTIQESSSSQ